VHLEKLLHLGILIQVPHRERSAPHGPTRLESPDLATDQLLAFATYTIGGDDDIGLEPFPLVSYYSGSAIFLVLPIVHDLLAEHDIDTQLVELVDKHFVNKRPHLESARWRVGIQASVSQAVRHLEGRDHLLAIMLEGLYPGIMERDLVVLLQHVGPVLKEPRGAEAHEVHVAYATSQKHRLCRLRCG
jgi:hypothetical protein